jgi:hypothetical protein
MFVDAALLQAIGRLRRKQKMVYADAQIFLPGARLIVPETILASLGIAKAKGVTEA